MFRENFEQFGDPRLAAAGPRSRPELDPTLRIGCGTRRPFDSVQT